MAWSLSPGLASHRAHRRGPSSCCTRPRSRSLPNRHKHPCRHPCRHPRLCSHPLRHPSLQPQPGPPRELGRRSRIHFVPMRLHVHLGGRRPGRGARSRRRWTATPCRPLARRSPRRAPTTSACRRTWRRTSSSSPPCMAAAARAWSARRSRRSGNVYTVVGPGRPGRTRSSRGQSGSASFRSCG